MQFAVFLTPKAGTAAERLELSRSWSVEGLSKGLWMHFPASKPRWLQVVETDDAAALMKMVRIFDDLYEIEVLPTEVGASPNDKQ